MTRISSLIVGILFISSASFSQVDKTETNVALLIVDIQEFYFPGEGPGLVGAEEASDVAKEVLQIFRENEKPVIHVRHQSSNGFEIHNNVKPIDGELVITKEEVNCFNGTDLLQELKDRQINRLVIIGMQTQMCLEAAVRAGYDHGFECIVIENACATRDLKFGETIIKASEVHASTLATIEGGGYGKVINLEGFKENLEELLFVK